jgi:hypothetical protein
MACPFDHSTQLRVFADPDLLQYDEVWAGAGTWNDHFGAAPTDIVRVDDGVVADFERKEDRTRPFKTERMTEWQKYLKTKTFLARFFGE